MASHRCKKARVCYHPPPPPYPSLILSTTWSVFQVSHNFSTPFRQAPWSSLAGSIGAGCGHGCELRIADARVVRSRVGRSRSFAHPSGQFEVP